MGVAGRPDMLPFLWAALDVLCKDICKAEDASTMVVKEMRHAVSLSPWHVLGCLFMMAKQVHRHPEAAAFSAIA